ncbi:hypothetical protein BGZ68_006927 [Mortierella alpina]|nr:hypothetical protein BGZ68_006927 [Mortierella alpina]
MTSDPRGQPTRTNPLELYEILSAVLSFLDRPSLMQAGLVCSSWRTCSQPILQQTCAILNQDLLRFFSPPSKFDLPLRTQMQAAQFVTQMQADQFVKTCHRVKSLRIGSILKRFDCSGGPFDVHSTPLLPMEHLSYLFQLYRAYQVHPHLKNLVHLDVHFNSETAGYACRGDEPTPQADFYAIMYGLILDNDNLQNLEFTDAGSSSISTLYERLCDLKVAHRVRRLSIKTDAAYFPFETLLSDLSKANAASSPNDAKEQEQGAGAEQWTLQELVLQSVRSHVRDRLSVYAKSASGERYPGIRSLTLLDFALYREVATDAESIADTDADTANDTLDTPSRYMDPKLYLIQQCPNLERLRISHDLSPISLSSRKSFSECVLSIVPDVEDASRWMQAPENFVQEMSKACPKLKAIDFGGNVDLSDTQWEELMGVYGRQLESVSVWGVLNFSAEALVQVDLCEQLGRLHRLRELTLEGQRDCRYDDREWDCMHLTLKTGLDRLEGLQNSLERLVLYQLQEELAGDQEVEWIAQHWIHHQNPVWQQRYQRQRQSHNGIIDDEEEDAEDDLWRPEPRFKELLGIGVRNTSSYSSALRAHANLAWLKQECPRLRIEKDHRIQDDDFYVGSFEDY